MREKSDKHSTGRAARTRGALGPHRASRDETIARTLKFIEHNENRAMRLADLCLAAGVSERTLRSMFLAAFGMAPHRYLRMRRLYLIHASLASGDPHFDTVGAIAARCGFLDGGRMASEYHAIFGEYPSDTLSRRFSERKR